MDIPSIIVDIIMGIMGFMIGVQSPATSILFYLLIREIGAEYEIRTLSIYLITAIAGSYMRELFHSSKKSP